MKRPIISLAFCFLLASSALAHAGSGALSLRPVDKATVRVIAVGGAHATAVESSRSKEKRVIAVPKAGHGTGVVIRKDGLILTARHVIEGADLLAIMLPGGDQAVPAVIVYVDPARDLAILRAKGPFRDVLQLPHAPIHASLGDAVSTSGYPLDVRQRFPAAASGEVSRMTNNGYLQLSMSVNPGNSGGPVITKSGALLGIVVRRGDTKAGVEGVAIVEPLTHVLRAVQRAVAQLEKVPVRFTEIDESRAHIVTRFVRAEDNGEPIYNGTAPALLEKVAASSQTPEELIMLAAYAWNMHVALLEKHSAASVGELSGTVQLHASRLLDIAGRSARDAMQRAPYVVRLYPIGRSIVNSQTRAQAVGIGIAPSAPVSSVTAPAAPMSSATAPAAPRNMGGELAADSGVGAVRATAPKWSLTLARVSPTGDLGDSLATSVSDSFGVSVRRGFGALGLRADGVLWSHEDSGPGGEELNYGFLHLGMDLRLAAESARTRYWLAGGVGLDASLIDVDAPVDSGAMGIGVNVELGFMYQVSQSTGVEFSMAWHPGYTPFFEEDGLPSIPDISYFALATGLSFH